MNTQKLFDFLNDNGKNTNDNLDENQEEEELIFDPLRDIQHVQVIKKNKLNIDLNFIKNKLNSSPNKEEENNIKNKNDNVKEGTNKINSILSDKLKRKIDCYQNLLIYRSRHYCDSNKRTSEILNNSENIESYLRKSKIIANTIGSSSGSSDHSKKLTPTDIIGSIDKSFVPSLEIDNKISGNNMENIENIGNEHDLSEEERENKDNINNGDIISKENE